MLANDGGQSAVLTCCSTPPKPPSHPIKLTNQWSDVMAIDLKSIGINSPKPPRIALYGNPGVGKTTFASEAEKPIFILTEDGLGSLQVKAVPTDENGKPRAAISFDEVLECLEALGTQEHDFKTVVIDSLDALEPLLQEATCKRINASSIEAPGYGKGYNEALVEWRQFRDYVTALRDQRDMTVIMIAHGALKRVEDPEHPAYDTNSLKLQKGAAALITEFADVVGFATQKTYTVEEKVQGGDKRIRAVASTDRVLRLSVSPAFTAKNRYRMPAEVKLDYKEFAKHLPQNAGGK